MRTRTREREVKQPIFSAKTKRGLYRINKPKGKKERFVYVSPKVIRKLKKNNWQPNQTNRFNFYHFLKKIKRELSISDRIELTPHTLRRSFTTHHANLGMPLPLLKKLLGHSSIRTTALYWHNTDGDGNNDTPDIPQVKKWLEKREKEIPEPPNTENFPMKSPETSISSKKPLIKKENSPLLNNYQPKTLISQTSPEKQAKFSLNIANKKKEISGQLPVIINNPSQNLEKEKILLIKIKQLEEQLIQVQKENKKLKSENQQLKMLIQQDQEKEAKVIQALPLK